MISIAPSHWLINAPFCMFMKKLLSKLNEAFLIGREAFNRSQWLLLWNGEQCMLIYEAVFSQLALFLKVAQFTLLPLIAVLLWTPSDLSWPSSLPDDHVLSPLWAILWPPHFRCRFNDSPDSYRTPSTLPSDALSWRWLVVVSWFPCDWSADRSLLNHVTKAEICKPSKQSQLVIRCQLIF